MFKIRQFLELDQLNHSSEANSVTKLVFCYQNCSDLLWEKIVLVIKENFLISRLKAKNLQNFWDHYYIEQFIQAVKVHNNFW